MYNNIILKQRFWKNQRCVAVPFGTSQEAVEEEPVEPKPRIFDILSLNMVSSLRPVPDVESQGVMVSPKCQRVEELKTGS